MPSRNATTRASSTSSPSADSPREMTRDFVVNGLLPELRRRGIVGNDYVGGTFRDNLELPPLPPSGLTSVLQLCAVHDDPHAVGVERHVVVDARRLRGGERVEPGGVLDRRGAARPGERQIRRRPLVRAGRPGVGGGEELGPHVDAGHVVAHRQRRLEQQSRADGVGDERVTDEHLDVPGGRQHVDADIRVAGVDEHLLILLVPGVHPVPVERDVRAEVEGVLQFGVVSPHGLLGATVADDEIPVPGLALPRAGRGGVDGLEEVEVHVVAGNVVNGQVPLLEQVHRTGGVGNHLTAEQHPDALMIGFDRDAAVLRELLGGGGMRESCGHHSMVRLRRPVRLFGSQGDRNGARVRSAATPAVTTHTVNG
ncbi:FMNH2-dependent monooxygenase [Rhodococcus wratislaviensis IFP 2016]|nr:FMNH2-dependent monooxygenase [Rhodococcus wratislaviensis IFP 2016]